MMKHLAATVLWLFMAIPAWAQTYSFGVVPHRSAVLTAQYWNPILEYAGRKSGVTLRLETKKTTEEYSEAESRGDFDFVHSNRIFAPIHRATEYLVIARSAGKPIHGQLVVAADSPIRALPELEGRKIGFPNRNGFTGYAVPMSALIAAGIKATWVFGGTQEGIMAQLRSGQIQAAGVNSKVMEEYARRENFNYRALWTSEPYLDLPVAAHPRVPPRVVKAVREALTGMAADAEGLKVLKASATIVNQEAPWGFIPAQGAEYRKEHEVYGALRKKEARRD